MELSGLKDALSPDLLGGGGRGFSARTAIFDWIESCYNRERRHSRFGYASPAAYEHDYYERSDCASGTEEKIFIEEQARAA